MDNQKSRDVLGIKYRTAGESITEMAQCMIDMGQVKNKMNKKK